MLFTNPFYQNYVAMSIFIHIFSQYELGLPETDPVYTLKKAMEKLDDSRLLSRYSDKGRKGYNPITL